MYYESYPYKAPSRFSMAMIAGGIASLGGLGTAFIVTICAMTGGFSSYAPPSPTPAAAPVLASAPVPAQGEPASPWVSQATLTQAQPYLASTTAGEANPAGHQFKIENCKLGGAAISDDVHNGDLTVDDVHYKVEQAQGLGDQTVYTGPQVRAVFTKGEGVAQQSTNGVPIIFTMPGTLRLETAGNVVTVPAQLQCAAS